MARAAPACRNPHRPGVIAAIERASALAAVARGQGALHPADPQAGAGRRAPGFAFPGHTEFLAHLCDSDDVVMMLARSRPARGARHDPYPLSEVPAGTDGRSAGRAHPHHPRALRAIRHRGTAAGGGRAEPACRRRAAHGARGDRHDRAGAGPVARRRHGDLQVPCPPTRCSTPGAPGYDAAICMYHDQALIPIKTLDFDRGVNVTLGLPFVRTSPDHGTAFDIAGTGGPTRHRPSRRCAWPGALAGTAPDHGTTGGDACPYLACGNSPRRVAPKSAMSRSTIPSRRCAT